MNTYYIYREITSKEELMNFFSLRYETFKSGDLSALVKEVSCGLDIDAFDLRARHFGIYRIENGQRLLIAGHRLIFESEMPVAPILQEIISENFEKSTCFNQRPEYPFYMIQLSSYKIQMMQYYKELKLSGKRIIESSRFFVHPNERSIKLLEFFGLCGLTIAFSIHSIDYGITSCNKVLARFNKRFGFRLYPKTKNGCIKSYELYNLIVSKKQIPLYIRTELKKMEEAFLMTDQICFTPESAESYFIPGYTIPFYHKQFLIKAA